MKFWTIWTSGYPLREKLHRSEEWFMRGLAHRLPRRLAYWSFIDSGVRYIVRSRSCPVCGTRTFSRECRTDEPANPQGDGDL